MITIEKEGNYNRTKVITIEEVGGDVVIKMDGSDGEYSPPSLTLREIQELLEKYKNKVVTLREKDLNLPLINPTSVEDLDNQLSKIVLDKMHGYSFRIPSELPKEEFDKMETIFKSSTKYEVYAGDSSLERSAVIRLD